MADRYGLSTATVKNHIRAVYHKLEINSKGELLALALQRRG
ncbi:LuxR C-terminal-related transcriptional regulator [Hymenobacter sp. BRD67]|nr:LuxR C-terminal-related transcriptional regulator [Hymenobacter sp. BRD67]QKG54982.1 response regulator transcription factor [Hymenobacter sp. BRD67]